MANIVTRIIIGAKDEASGVFQKIQANAGKLAAGVAAFFGGRAIAGAIETSIDAAEKLDRQMRVIEQAIKATGGAAGLTAVELDDMARRLDEATLGSAEGFRDAAAKLLTFKSVGKDSFETVLMLAADLEATGFGNLQTNIVQLGKAMEDPVKGMTALAKSGVTFTDAQVDVIASLVATGKAAEAQAVILSAVKGQVEGVASAAGGGMAGAIDLVGKRLTDMKGQLGKAVLPALNDFYLKIAEVYKRLSDSGVVTRFGEVLGGVFRSATDTFVRFAESFDIDSVVEKLRAWAVSTKEAVDEIAGFLSTASGVFNLFFSSLRTGINTIQTAFFGVAGVVASFASSVTGAFATVLEQMARVSDRYKDAAAEARAVSDVFGASAEQNFNKASGALADTAEAAQKTVTAVKDLVGVENEAAQSADALTENTRAAGAQAVLTADQLDALGEGAEFVDGKVKEAAKSAVAAVPAVEALGDSAEGTANKLEEAFKALGVTSTAALQQQAAEARTAFETIRNSGQATTQDLTAAWVAWAEKAQLANGGVLTSAQQIEGVVHGVSLEVQRAGESLEAAMQKATVATNETARSAESAADGYARIADEAQGAADVIDRVAEASANMNSIVGSAASGGGGTDFSDLVARAGSVGGDEGREEALAIIRQWVALSNAAIRRGNTRGVPTTAQIRESIKNLIERLEAVQERERALIINPASAGQTKTGGSSLGADESGTQPRAASSSHTLTVKFDGGRSTTIATANESESLKLISVLEEFQRRASV